MLFYQKKNQCCFKYYLLFVNKKKVVNISFLKKYARLQQSVN